MDTDNILFWNALLQTFIMFVTVVVTWFIYQRRQIDIRKDAARRILVEYETSVDLLIDIKQIISPDASNYDVMKLLAINFYDYSYWKNHNHILYRELNVSEFKNINTYFNKLKNMCDTLGMIKNLTEDEIKNLYGNAAMEKALHNNDCPANLSLCIVLPKEYTIPILEACKEMDLLVKIFPKEKIESLSK